MLLLHDGKVMTSHDPQCTIAHFLLPVCELLNAAHHRAYISILSVDRAVRCLLTLLQESRTVAGGKWSEYLYNLYLYLGYKGPFINYGLGGVGKLEAGTKLFGVLEWGGQEFFRQVDGGADFFWPLTILISTHNCHLISSHFASGEPRNLTHSHV